MLRQGTGRKGWIPPAIPALTRGGAGGTGAGHRGLKIRVKSGRKKASSRRWLERQLNDPYVARARHDGYRSRAAYKLLEIDARYGLIKPGMRIVDLGAAPGGWSQVAAAKTGSSVEKPLVVAIDTLGMEPLAGVVVLEKDFLDSGAPDLLHQALGGEKAYLVLSDMAAPTTGHKATDHLRIMGLCEAAADFARQVLAPGGHFLAKVFRGGTEHALLADLKRDFTKVVHVKPPASRPDSAELYLLAMDFRGGSTR
ncbi:MAG: RlmE family RNA methyltransferase [Alphaproteobacteria bacterium]|nr:MAG: RlmE family RNA methyltransferase [Alphaproteobacteria bacterium]